MRIFHLSDLHLGKQLEGYSMIDEQKEVLNQVVAKAHELNPAAILIAGDVYDKSIASEEAMLLFESFLNQVAPICEVFIISGNHDSANRLAIGSEFYEKGGVHIAREYDGKVSKYKIHDEFGELVVHLMPFVRPNDYNRLFSETEEKVNSNDYTEMMRRIVEKMNVDTTKRNILIAHQFVTGTSGVDGIERSDSELQLGTLDNVDASVFKPFDYVALGHIHKPQRVERETIRYCGSPVKYSLSEVNHKKSLTCIEIKEKNQPVDIQKIDFKPLHDLIRKKGFFEDVIKEKSQDYVGIQLEDENYVEDVFNRLRTNYPRLVKVEYVAKKNQHLQNGLPVDANDKLSPNEMFRKFFVKYTNSDLSPEQAECIDEMINEIWNQ